MVRIILSLAFTFVINLAIAQTTVNCLIKTSLGDIELELYPEKAPITVKNFMRYVDAGLYTNSSFYRVCTKENEAAREIRIEVIQGGNIPENSGFDPIPIETTDKTGVLHKNGAISMARGKPDTATSSFFICINDQPELDFGGDRNPDGQGFAAFGNVTKGMDVVLAIQKGHNTKQMLKEPVKILSIAKVNE